MSAQAQPQQQVPRRQILERPPPFSHFEVQPSPAPNHVMLVIVDNVTAEIHSYSLHQKYAAELGRELTAPSVEIAQSLPNGNGRG